MEVTTMDINNLTGPELAHFGVLGMKWGRRKDKVKAKISSPKSRHHEDYTRAHTGESYKSMSTKRLKEVNDRLQAEKTYKELTTKQKKKGKNWVTNTLKNVGSQQLSTVLNKYAIPAAVSFVAAAYATHGKGPVNGPAPIKKARRVYDAISTAKTLRLGNSNTIYL